MLKKSFQNHQIYQKILKNLLKPTKKILKNHQSISTFQFSGSFSWIAVETNLILGW